MPDEPEAKGLLALILFSHLRRSARIDMGEGFAPLHLQDRALWDARMIKEGHQIIEQALSAGQIGAYQLQAAIHGVHCDAANAGGTDWPQIVGLYSILMRIEPSAVVAVNQAVAMSFAGQSKLALRILEGFEDELKAYQPFYAAKAEILVRLCLIERAHEAYDRAIALSQVEAERCFLLKRKQNAQ